jgi:diacylglycerol kinase (ATP)
MQESPYKGKTGVKRVFNALMYSLDGMKAALQYEDAFRQEMLLSVVLIPLALYLERNAVERVLMIASVLFVLVVELLNSAVEAAVDRISLEHHHLIKRAKDMGSAAVLISLLNVLVVWGLILLGG